VRLPTVGNVWGSDCRRLHPTAIDVVVAARDAALLLCYGSVLLVTGVILGEEGLATLVCRKEVVQWLREP